MHHTINAALFTNQIRLMLIGCGGTGTSVASSLYYFDAALRTQGHRGLQIVLMDGDIITDTNLVRAPFSPSERGLNKAVVIANRTNLFRGTDWRAIPRHYLPADSLKGIDILITCVDNRSTRAMIAEHVVREDSSVVYWLDIGNLAAGGQWLLGEPANKRNAHCVPRLPTIAELLPELLIADPSDDAAPSCSAAEALDRQEPLVNANLADQAIAALIRLFRHGKLSYHGAFWNLDTGHTFPINVDPTVWASMQTRASTASTNGSNSPKPTRRAGATKAARSKPRHQ